MDGGDLREGDEPVLALGSDAELGVDAVLVNTDALMGEDLPPVERVAGGPRRRMGLSVLLVLRLELPQLVPVELDPRMLDGAIPHRQEHCEKDSAHHDGH